MSKSNDTRRSGVRPRAIPTRAGYFGEFGGRFVPETLMAPVEELTAAYFAARATTRASGAELGELLRDYVGRPTPLYEAQAADGVGRRRAHLPQARGSRAHRRAQDQQRARPGAARRRAWASGAIVAETGAGQHGVATATVCALLGLECVVYMGADDMARQALNVFRMRLLGADGRARRRRHADAEGRDQRGDARLGDQRRPTRYYLLGSVLGPHPYPLMVREFQSVIGQEARAQFLAQLGRLPDVVVACVGGGSNAMGIFDAFIDDPDVALDRRRGGRPRHHARRSRGAVRRRQRRRAARHAQLRAAGRGRQHRARRTRFPPASTTRRSGPSTRGCATRGRAEYTWIDDDGGARRVSAARARGRHPAGARVVARDRARLPARADACRRTRSCS